MTLAPQSASSRTAVGPERTRVRSSTGNRDRACEAGRNGILHLLAAPNLRPGLQTVNSRQTVDTVPAGRKTRAMSEGSDAIAAIALRRTQSLTAIVHKE